MPSRSTPKKRSRRFLLPAGAGAVLASSLLVLTTISTASGAVRTVTPAATHEVIAAVSTTHRTSRRVTPSQPVGMRTVSTDHHSTEPAAPKATRRHIHRHEARHHAAAKTTTSSPTTVPATTDAPSTEGYGCTDALSYLESHAAAGFTFECPGYALGHQAMTCIDVAGVCAGEHLIVINDPCQAAYMNEASNSWVLEGLRSAPIDPYGYCHD
jgi:hypothetical protein